jgi:hypothetical protein
VLFGALAVADDPIQILVQLQGELVGRVLGTTQPLSGVEPGLDTLGDLNFLLGVEQGDFADLLEVGVYRVGRGSEVGVLAGLAQCLGFLLVPD